MNHALIVEENLVLAKVLEQQLLSAGFRSFDHAWTEDDAVAAALLRLPDLIVVGDNLEEGCGINAARRICEHHDIPVLRATATGATRRETLPHGVTAEGPFSIREIKDAVDAARAVPLAS